jgi:hypothetical protein
LKCCLRYEFDLYEQQELPLVQLGGELSNGCPALPSAVPLDADDSET